MHDTTPFADDPDVRQAIEDKLEDVAEIRDLAVKVMNRRDPRYTSRIRELFADLRLRAERINVEPDTLLRLVSEELATQGRAGPTGEVRRRLLNSKHVADRDELAAYEELAKAKEKADAATRARQHALQRCLAFGIEA